MYGCWEIAVMAPNICLVYVKHPRTCPAIRKGLLNTDKINKTNFSVKIVALVKYYRFFSFSDFSFSIPQKGFAKCLNNSRLEKYICSLEDIYLRVVPWKNQSKLPCNYKLKSYQVMALHIPRHVPNLYSVSYRQ